jgi:hypothetical protein
VGAVTGDRVVVALNLTETTNVAPAGALAFLVGPNPGNGNDRIEILVRSHGGRWVRKWEDIRRLTNFRAKTLPPPHPLHGDERLWDYEPVRYALALWAARAGVR